MCPEQDCLWWDFRARPTLGQLHRGHVRLWKLEKTILVHNLLFNTYRDICKAPALQLRPQLAPQLAPQPPPQPAPPQLPPAEEGDEEGYLGDDEGDD